MKMRIKVAVCALAAGLLTPPAPAAAGSLSAVDSAVLDPSRSAVFHGMATEAEAVHRARLSSGPQGDALRNLAESSKYVVQTTPEMLAGDEIDPVTFDECQSHQVTPANPIWFKNKYNSCVSTALGIDHYVTRNGQRVLTGTSVFRRSYISIAQPAENRIKFGIRLIHDHDEDVVDDSVLVDLKIGCLEVHLDPAWEGSCTTSLGGAPKTIAQLKVENGADPAWFESTLSTTKASTDMYSAERRGYFSVDHLVTVTDREGRMATTFYPAADVRCDDAKYVSGSKCVFHKVSSSLALYTSDPKHGESAKFIKDAQTNLVLTYPGSLGKKVPGRFGEEPLHRLYKDYDTKNDIAGSHRKVRRACQVRWGVDYTLNAAGEVLQCDEYPFATTYENSARVNDSTPLTYAVRPVNALHNETAGQLYGKWLGTDHILDGDPFYVIIR
ncbi:hypothetical protein [Amycolatopsis sp. NPDC049159]|uniref:hypothetical protein n=1 Tax=Amycolatopsis sp. NPDC049159 TaxID=3157210 RepID=UPI0033DA85BB